MNIFFKGYARIFQTVFKIALPVLPYRDPRIVEKTADVPVVLIENKKFRPLVVTDKNLLALGLVDPLFKALEDCGIAYSVYSSVVANPTTTNVKEAKELFELEKCDSLIAFGGGSPMDCAKAVGACVVKKKPIGKMKGILKVGKKIPLLIAIPTTSGTGSETTLASVIVDGETRHKYAVNDFPLIPSYAVLDAENTMSLPFSVVATTGMDALTHAVEAYIGKSGNKATRTDALEATKGVIKNLENSAKVGDLESRKNMLIASHKAGRAFSKAYVGYVHAIAHSLGGKYDTPHGLANAVILPYVLKAYGKAAYKKLSELAIYCGIGDKDASKEENAKAFIAEIERLNSALSIPEHLPFIEEKDFEELATYAYKEGNPLYPVPVLWDKKDFVKVLKQVKGND